MAFYSFDGKFPVVGEGTYVHPEATLIGNVVIGKGRLVGPGARLRGDWGFIRIGDSCNIQDNCVIHAQPGKGTQVGDRCHIAHSSILHGPVLEDEVFVGMGCIVMDDAVLKQKCCLAAGTLVLTGQVISEDTLAMGHPAKEIKKIPAPMRENLEWARGEYIALPPRYLKERTE